MRGFAYRWVCVAALAGLVILGAPASADELVKFTERRPRRPGPGLSHPAEGRWTLSGGRAPAHRPGLPAGRAALGERIAAWGYVALFVDDFGARGLKETCTVDFPQGFADAYGALSLLAGRPFVDAGRIAAVGFSQGGDTALKIAAAPVVGAGAFNAAAAFYPPCANEADATLAIPTLILVGAKDGVTPAADCAALANRQAPGMVKLVIYPARPTPSTCRSSARGRQVMGMTLAYDHDAAERAWAELRAFLAKRPGQ